MTLEIQRIDLSNKAQSLFWSTDAFSYSALGRIRSKVEKARRGIFLLWLSIREISREFCKFCRRTQNLLASTRHYYTGSFGSDLGPAFGAEANGHPVRCTRTLGRIQGIQKLSRSNGI
jgi:hypothetical protein